MNLNLIWFLLFTLGWSLIYAFLQRSMVARGRGSIWLLWLVIMMPVLVFTLWAILYVPEIALERVLVLLILWSLVNWVLLRHSLAQLNKQEKSASDSQTSASSPPSPDPNLLPESLKPLSSDEEAILNHCFPWSLFALHKVEYRLQAVICQGQLRADPADAYRQIQQNIEARFGDRFLVLLQENWQGKPFFALVPNPKAKPNHPTNQEPLNRVGLALGLLLATLVTTTLIGTTLAEESLTSIEPLFENPQLLLQGLPYGITLMLILGVHELGHYVTAKRHKIKTTLPYFIPFPAFLGTFGAFIQIRSPIPNRKALFDVGVAGPLAGLVVTLPLLLWGLAHSDLQALDKDSGLVSFESLNPWRSILLALLSRLALGSAFTADTSLSLHPVAIAGCLGLIVTALNLMPVGQLDGGHIVHAMFGQRTGAVIGQVARLCMLLLSIVQPEFLIWAIILWLIPVIDEPALNDVSELNDWRDALGFVSLALLILIILPMPQFFIRLLG